MPLTTTELANKRTRKVLRRRTLRNGRRRNAGSLERGQYRARRRADAQARANMQRILEQQQDVSRAAVKAASSGKRGGFMDGVKSRLFKLLPRRIGGGE